MNLKLLIDELVRQTTVLIAQLSTTAGVRSPLSRVADQVFLQLSRELESQGVSRAVAADMFGMALRTYQRKIARVTESASAQGHTLWEAVYHFIKQEAPTRQRVSDRFHSDGEREVAAVLHDLLSNGLVYATGTGAHTSYGATSERMQAQVMAADDLDALAHVIWLRIFQGIDHEQALADATGFEVERIRQAVIELERQGRVTRHATTLLAENVCIPIGATSGAEAAMIDHFRGVCQLLVVRSRALLDRQLTEDGPAVPPLRNRDGGSTFRFSVYPGHPFEPDVAKLLDETRTQTQSLWHKVAAYNEESPPPIGTRKVTFYCGQVTLSDDEDYGNENQ